VASALYLGALYAKNEKIAVRDLTASSPPSFHRRCRSLVRVVPDGDRLHPGDEPSSRCILAWSVNFFIWIEWKYANRTFGLSCRRSLSTMPFAI
jgi:hypothetical protein